MFTPEGDDGGQPRTLQSNNDPKLDEKSCFIDISQDMSATSTAYVANQEHDSDHLQAENFDRPVNAVLNLTEDTASEYDNRSSTSSTTWKPSSSQEINVEPTLLPRATNYIDPLIAVKEMMWLIPGINEIVDDILDRMEKRSRFAYNSVYFLKVILDLQALYLPMKPAPESEIVLDVTRILRIARVLSGRLARKSNVGHGQNYPSASLFRELQLRTLISALSLLYQYFGTLNSDSYARLLRDVTEREAEIEARRTREDYMETGENEFLTRYACDLIRCLPSDLSGYRGCNQEAIHFLFAAGFIVSKLYVFP